MIRQGADAIPRLVTRSDAHCAPRVADARITPLGGPCAREIARATHSASASPVSESRLCAAVMQVRSALERVSIEGRRGGRW